MIMLDIEMPIDCIECPMQSGGYCDVSTTAGRRKVANSVEEALKNGKPDWCPISGEKTGRWIEEKNFYGEIMCYTCSVCGNWKRIEGTPRDNGLYYCPNCGAKMKGVSDERN